MKKLTLSLLLTSLFYDDSLRAGGRTTGPAPVANGTSASNASAAIPRAAGN